MPGNLHPKTHPTHNPLDKSDKDSLKKNHKVTNQIFVGGCHPRITKDQLMDYFSQFG
jgi:RNA recognition motif-containing protein